MAIYSKPAKLAVRILVQVAGHEEEGQLCAVRDVAVETGVSEPTVAKILQMLAKDGVLESRKGPGGGFRLAKPAQEISLLRIVTAIEGGTPLADCAGGFEECSELNPCPLHPRWKSVKAAVIQFLEGTSLYDLLKAARRVRQVERV